MTLNFVPARYARVQAKESMCSPRGDWLCGEISIKESVLTSVKESRVCQFLANLYITGDSVVRIRIVTKSKHALIAMKKENGLFRSSLSLISIVTSFLFCKKMYIYYIMINSSKISIHRFIATTLFRVVKEWILPDECGHSLTTRNSVVAIKRSIEMLLLLIIIVTAPLRVERCPKFILFKFKKYILYMYVYILTLDFSSWWSYILLKINCLFVT